MQTHVVTRRFNGPGSVQLMAGTQIDASAWPNLKSLVDTNYLRPLDANEMAAQQGAESGNPAASAPASKKQK